MNEIYLAIPVVCFCAAALWDSYTVRRLERAIDALRFDLTTLQDDHRALEIEAALLRARVTKKRLRLPREVSGANLSTQFPLLSNQ